MAQGQEYPVFIRFILEQTGLEKAKEIETYLKGVERAAISTTRNFSSFSSAVLNLVNKQNLLLGVGLAVVGSIGAFAASTVNAAARAEELQNTTELLANRMGVSATEVDKAAIALQRMGYTAKSSYTAIIELIRGQVDLSKLHS